MTVDEVLLFLQAHQPLPADADLTDDVIRKFDEIRLHLAAQPDVACLKPMLGALGEGDGLGVYPLVAGTIREFGPAATEEALRWGLEKPRRSVRYWAAQFAAEYPSAGLVDPLLHLLDEDDRDIKYASLTAFHPVYRSIPEPPTGWTLR